MEFPAFLFGTEEAVIARAETVGATWRAARGLAGTELRAVQAGELVIVHHGTLDPFTPRWMLFGAGFASSSATHGLPPDEAAAFAEALGATPWGALAACERQRPPNTVAAVTRRAHRLFAHWDELATLRYIGRARALPAVVTLPGLNQPSISLDELVAELFDGPLGAWGPQLGSTRARLDAALATMATASPATLSETVCARMLELARANRRIRDTHAADPSVIAALVESLSGEELAALAPCLTSELVSALYELWRGGPPAPLAN